MKKETIEYASIILDLIAFFLVTIDLYGKRRLQVLSNKLKQIELNKVHEDIADSGEFIFFNLIIHIVLFAAIAFAPALILVISINRLLIPFYNLFHKQCGFNYHIVYWIVITLLYLCMQFAVMKWTEKVLPKSVSYLRNNLLRKIVEVPLVISQLLPIEGIMLAIGTILFIVSKMLSFIVVGM